MHRQLVILSLQFFADSKFIADFNAKSRNCYWNGITSFEVHRLNFFPLNLLCLNQVIKEPTHLLDNSKSCIDLIFTSQHNTIMDSGFHPSLHSNCHQIIIYAKFDLKVFYSSPYERTVWHFSWANSDHIKEPLAYSIGNLHLIISMSMTKFPLLMKQLWTCLILLLMN